jgi:hypothetical protein
MDLQVELTAAEKALDAAIAALEVLPRASKRGISPLVEDAFTRVRTVRAKLAALLLRVEVAPLVATGLPEAAVASADSSNVKRAPDAAPKGASRSSKKGSPAPRRRRTKRRSGGAK